MDDSAEQTAELLVVGAGIAAHRFVARMLEDPERDVRITVFGDEGRLPYDRSGLARVVAGDAASGIDLDRAPFRDDRVRLIDDDRVLRIDRAGRRVRTRSRRWYDYDALILATGTHARPLEVPGIRARGSFTFRSMEDAQTLRAFLAIRATELPRALRAVVVGGDETGVDVALALNEAGVQTTLVATTDRLLPSVLSASAAASLRRVVEARGITVRTRTRLTRVDPDEAGAVTAVEFQDGTFARADLVVTTAARARDELALNAGLPVRQSGGVIVDADGRTEDERILAIGDVAVGAVQLERGVEAACSSAGRAVAALCGAPLADPGPRRWYGRPGGIDLAVLRIDDVREPVFAVPLPALDGRRFGEILLSENARQVYGATTIGEPGEPWLTRLSRDDTDRRTEVRVLLAPPASEHRAEKCGHGLLTLPLDALSVELDRRGIRTFPDALAAAGESRDCGPCLRRLAIALLQRDPAPADIPDRRPGVRLRGTAAASVVDVELGREIDAALLLTIGRLAQRHDATIGLGEGTITVGGIRDGDLPRVLAGLRAAGAVIQGLEPETGGRQPVTPLVGPAEGGTRRRRDVDHSGTGTAAGVRSAEGAR
ncbi:FAD-dependent oxidoreductase [Zhihengliuella sp. ISTPL4]|uniref:FAD-dependent oxidoreductase n=1 Tax=Zhihengliuella sp. ISTPL4 TaxID=2058657 RepID=UPI000C7D2025|nr:FAD-dependent oxidoreductase [Zhihengliuella sp. ISTPL4]